MKKLLIAVAVCLLLLASCRYSVREIPSGPKVILVFNPYTQGPFTKGEVSSMRDYVSKINVMLFDSNGEKALDKVRTQTLEDGDFGVMEISIPAGEYTLVAVAHSSTISASIKSLEQVTFTASNGEKLTDTFYYCGKITVGDEAQTYDIPLKRNIAMFRLVMTDEDVPENVTHVKFDYSGGSANFNPSTGLGCTKSTQSENRPVSDSKTYEIYTFPYMAESGTIKVTVSALDAGDVVIKKKVFESVPVTQNMITEYKGAFFDGSPSVVAGAGFTFTIDADWDGTNTYTYEP